MAGAVDIARRRTRRRWAVVTAAGVLIAAALTLRGVAPPAFDLLLIAATVTAGAGIAARAVRDLRIRRIGIEALVSIAAVGALAIGEVWEAAAVTWLFALGGALEAMTIGRTRRALSHLLDLVPETATVRRDGELVRVPPSQVRVGEIVIVRPGDRVPVDGDVVAGHVAADESTITGESLPVEKDPGDRLFAGTITSGGVAEVRARHTGSDTALGRIIHRVEEAQEHKVPAQRMLERFARWYTPGVVVLAIAAWLLTRDVRMALTLLVISCPGALVISIPVSVVSGVGRGARAGILVKGGEHLERTAAVTTVAFDKTGTLTEGRPAVRAVRPLAAGVTPTDLLTWAARAEAGSEHPLAQPLVAAARAAGVVVPDRPEDFVAHPGGGVAATVEGTRVIVGTPELLRRLGVAVPPHVAAALDAERRRGRTSVAVAAGDRVAGLISFADRVRDDAADAVAALRRAGVRRQVMLTGDAAPVAHAVASEVGISEVRAGLSPDDKLDVIRRLQDAGEVVAMLGDGVNDAPALVQADVGVAVGAAATPVALETADLAVTTGQLTRVADALHLSRRTVRVMRQNVAIALATVAALLAGVLAGHVHMAGGMLVHQASVLAVIANAMRLLHGRRGAHDGSARPGRDGGRPPVRSPVQAPQDETSAGAAPARSLQTPTGPHADDQTPDAAAVRGRRSAHLQP